MNPTKRIPVRFKESILPGATLFVFLHPCFRCDRFLVWFLTSVLVKGGNSKWAFRTKTDFLVSGEKEPKRKRTQFLGCVFSKRNSVCFLLGTFSPAFGFFNATLCSQLLCRIKKHNVTYRRWYQMHYSYNFNDTPSHICRQ